MYRETRCRFTLYGVLPLREGPRYPIRANPECAARMGAMWSFLRSGRRVWLTCAGLSAAFVLCAGCHSSVSESPVGPAAAIPTPLGLPPVPIPADNYPTVATIAFGRSLFYDPRLSIDGSIACSTCHNPQYYFTDGASVSQGVGGSRGVRNAPTILNAAYLPFQFWDGRAITLKQQAASPIVNPVEMKNESHKGCSDPPPA